MKTADLIILDELKAAVRAHTPAEYAALKAEIISSGIIHDPILWARLSGGIEVLIDGHTRLEILEALRKDSVLIDEPRTVEIEALRDGTVEDAVQWIRTHQASRRNDESLARTYLIGQDFLKSEATSTEIAEKHGVTPSQVRHAGTVAAKIDAADKLSPGTKAAILQSDVPKSVIRDSEPEEIVNAVSSGRRPKPPGQLDNFRPLLSSATKAAAELKAASRACNELINNQTPSDWSNECEEKLKTAHQAIADLTSAVEKWMKASVL